MKSKRQSLHNIKAILWDMDGVLVDSEDIHPVIESQTAKHFGINLSPKRIRELYLGSFLEKEFRDMIKTSGVSGVTASEMIKVRNELLKEYLKKGIKSIPHAKEVVNALASSYKQAVVSSGERFWGENALDKLELFKYFDLVIFGEDVKNHKPHPEPFLKAAEILNLEPEQCLVIEDSENGVKASKEAGMLVIARKANHNKDRNFTNADFVVSDLREIPGILNTKLL